MLRKQEFLQGLKILKAMYPNWKLDIENKDVLVVWYSKFQNLDEQQFQAIINDYTDKNDFPPNSPKSLLDMLRENYKSKELNPDEAWNKIRELNMSLGFNYNAKKIFAKLEEHPALLETAMDYENELRTYQSSDTYLAKQFKDSYESNLKRHIENKVYNQPQIGYVEKLLKLKERN